MKAIILAAGEGKRLGELTKTTPKCLAISLNGKTLLELQVQVFHSAGIRDIVIVVGHAGSAIQNSNLRVCWNYDYAETGILDSLFAAEHELNEDVIISYSDIWYEQSVLRSLLQNDDDITIAIDRNWEPAYEGRTAHPISEAEKVALDSNNRVVRIGKMGISQDVDGEFIGLLKLTQSGCGITKTHYLRARETSLEKPFQRASSFRTAYLTDLLQEMIDHGTKVTATEVKGRWREIDTVQDLERFQLQTQRISR